MLDQAINYIKLLYYAGQHDNMHIYVLAYVHVQVNVHVHLRLSSYTCLTQKVITLN